MTKVKEGHEVATIQQGLLAVDRYVTVTALNIPEGLDFEQWASLSRGLGTSHRMVKNGSVMFHVGDWLNYSERHQFMNSGEAYSQALEATGYTQNTLYNCKSVCKLVTAERRREDLSFSHHAAVAPLSEEDQTRLLAMAVTDGLNAGQLRKMADAVKHGIEEAEAKIIHENGATIASKEEEKEEDRADNVARLKADIPAAMQLSEDFFTMATAFQETFSEMGTVDPESVANLQATSKSLSEVTGRIFNNLMALL